MKMLNLFSGSGAVSLAAELYGIETVAMSEIEPFPIAVTNKHFPNAVQLGDVTKVDGGKIEPVDIIWSSSPCQNLSAAGKRDGLEGDRSILFYDSIRVTQEMLNATNGEYPKYFLFENVSNLISINNGLDFKAVMDAINSLGFICDVNMLNSIDFAIPQKRRRIFIVGVNEKHFNPNTYSNIPNDRNKSVEQALNQYPYKTFSGLVSRPFEPKPSALSDFLDTEVSEKHYLSEKFCQGMLGRMLHGNIRVPRVLIEALKYQAGVTDDTYDGLAFDPRNPPKVCTFIPGRYMRNRGSSFDTDCTPTLLSQTNFGDTHPCIAYNQKEVYSFEVGSWSHIYHERTGTLSARDYKSPVSVVLPSEEKERYVVRKLTASEYLKLMDLPPDFCNGLGTDNVTDELITYWSSIFTAFGELKKDQYLRKWIKEPYSDASVYKLAGNGVVVAVANWIFKGIVNPYDWKEHSSETLNTKKSKSLF